MATDSTAVDCRYGLDSEEEREELAFKLLASLPRSRLATIQRRIAPLLQFDVVGSLPAEVSLQIFSHLSAQTLLTCGLVSHRWQVLANDPNLWKNLCQARGWTWRQPPRITSPHSSVTYEPWDNSDDEGMGDSDEEEDEEQPDSELDSGFASTLMADTPRLEPSPQPSQLKQSIHSRPGGRFRKSTRHSAPSVLNSLRPASPLKPNYKLLHQTYLKLHNRFLSSSYRRSVLQTRGSPTNAHSSTIYCLQLYTYPSTGRQVLFTGSRDKSIREWDLHTGLLERIFGGIHSSSVLSSDRRVVVWDLEKNKPVKVICDHEDSVLCVRFDDERLVSCSKDRTVRTYSFPDLKPQFVLGAHRAAVNAVSISESYIVSGSGDRSVRLWDATTGKLLRTFDNHHSRGIASIDFRPPYVLSGSSDKHLRLVDITARHGGWGAPTAERSVCQTCGSTTTLPTSTQEMEVRCMHGDLVRSVALGDELALSGSYDLTIKVWDRKTGALVADLTGGHTGRIFCIGFDRTKIVSCGEDQRICIWDFSHGIDTSFIQLS
ncbi:WD40-repeat-containing domain protein [Infundibulicybe gibba]|nr:WD40-repeat-containing domain protein [Infundibulicybe gibba]